MIHEHASATAKPSRQPRTRENRWQIPIVNRNRRIIGWTQESPQATGAILRHIEAEKVVGGPVTATYIQITNRSAAERAGAPAGWIEPWRCLAIIAVADADGGPREHVPLLDVEA
jgi:hypothetical protein